MPPRSTNRVSPPGSMQENLRKLMHADLNRDGIIGTVTHRQIPGEEDPLRDGLYWCDIQPEKEGEAKLEYVPMGLRVMNYPDDLGIIAVPKMGTEVVIAFVDGRPTIDCCQEWDKLIVKKNDSNYFIWDKITNNVELKTTGTIHVYTPQTTLEEAGLKHQTDAPSIILGPIGAFSAVLGEILNTWLATHTHVVIPTTVPGVKVTGPPMQAATLPLHLSRRVKLDM